MDNEMRFRALLVALQNRLSDSDRGGLHFLLGNIIPRAVRDNLTINGTLQLLESLFDRGKITNQDFEFLIGAFEGIQRYDIADRLRAHAQSMEIDRIPVQPTLLQQLVLDTTEDEEDKVSFVSNLSPNRWETGERKKDALDRISSSSSQNVENQFRQDREVLDPMPNLNRQQAKRPSRMRNTEIEQPLLQFPAIEMLPPLFPPSSAPVNCPTPEPTVGSTTAFNWKKMFAKWSPVRFVLVVLGLIGILGVVLAIVFIVKQGPSRTPINDPPGPVNPMKNQRVVLGYFTAWSIHKRQYYVSNITADRLTHVNYAFATIDSDGELTHADRNADTAAPFPGDTANQPLRGNFNQLLKLKERHPRLRTLISVGGYEGSNMFHHVAATPQNRSVFAASCLDFLREYDFDGIDIVWLYPVVGMSFPQVHRPEDKENYVLLQELRRQLDTDEKKKYLLTIGAGTGQHIGNLDLPGMIDYLDWINVITYDFHGAWEAKTNHHAPLYSSDEERHNEHTLALNCDAAIQTFLDGGVPASKLVMGVPLYGRGWQGVKNSAGNGFLQSASSKAPRGTWESEPGVFDYDHLKRDFLPFYTRHFDNQSKATSLFNSSTGIWISYEDLESLGWKNQYILDRRLRGAGFWELSSDRQAELVAATYNKLSTKPYVFPVNSSSSTNNEIPVWKPDTVYREGDRVKWDNRIYRCTRRHTSATQRTPLLESSHWRLDFR